MTFRMLLLPMALLAAWGATPPKTGESAPAFTLPSLAGPEVKIDPGAGETVLVVLRGFPGYQCPICNRQVQDYVKNAPAFRELGVRVVLVYPGPPDNLAMRAQEFAANKSLPADFLMLLDPGYTFTNLYGLRWNALKETAYPSTFLIDGKGKVYFAKVSDSHGGRTTAAEVLEAIRKRR